MQLIIFCFILAVSCRGAPAIIAQSCSMCCPAISTHYIVNCWRRRKLFLVWNSVQLSIEIEYDSLIVFMIVVPEIKLIIIRDYLISGVLLHFQKAHCSLQACAYTEIISVHYLVYGISCTLFLWLCGKYKDIF